MKEIKKRIKYLVYKIIRILFYVFRIFPISNRKIVFNSFVGKGFCDNPKYIAKELMNINEDMDLVWIVNDLKEVMPKKNKKSETSFA